MVYDPHQQVKTKVLAHFKAQEARFPGVHENMVAFFATPTLTTARKLMTSYFKHHQKGDIDSLQLVTWAFADKSLVKQIVESIIDDESALNSIAASSYPHPIGFDKLVLHHDKESGFKLRLHIYWRGNQRVAMERLHLHKFEMASAIITGELTNHLWRVTSFENRSDIISGMQLATPNPGALETKNMYAYSGYWRDKDNILHKKYLGSCTLERSTSETYVSGSSYAQLLEDGHYVETNAETGTSNGDACSTIYIHGESLKDAAGRKFPVLFEETELANPDQIIGMIPPMDPQTLKNSLIHYRDVLAQSLEFYDWIYDPRHGRNLSVGMIAGYLLSEGYHSPHTLKIWMEQEHECKAILEKASVTLAKLIRGEESLVNISDDDRNKRYYAILLEKAKADSMNAEEWLDSYGDLVKEMWRYCGALKGEQPDITVLKPIWDSVVGKPLPGGAHYGHVGAMIEAIYEVKGQIMEQFGKLAEIAFDDTNSPHTQMEQSIESQIQKILKQHYPAYGFKGEEIKAAQKRLPRAGDKRWLVDPIDGTRNFLAARDDFAINIACQEFKNGVWETTDAVVALPATNKIYWAEKGKGAYLITGNNHEVKLRVKSTTDSLAHKLVDISVKGLGVDAETALIRTLRAENAIYRATGSAGIMLSLLAGKGNDGAIITANDYDVAAGKLVAQESGAKISELNFHRANHDFTATIAAQNDNIHDRLRQMTKSALGLSSQRAPSKSPSPQ